MQDIYALTLLAVLIAATIGLLATFWRSTQHNSASDRTHEL